MKRDIVLIFKIQKRPSKEYQLLFIEDLEKERFDFLFLLNVAATDR